MTQHLYNEVFNKGIVLLGLSENNNLINCLSAEEISTIRSDATQLLSSANQLKEGLINSNQPLYHNLVNQCQGLLDKVNNDYSSKFSSEFHSESKELWQELSNSQQANQFSAQSKQLLGEYISYIHSNEGKDLLSNSLSNVESSASFLPIINMIKSQHGSVEQLTAVVSSEDSVAQVNLTVQAATKVLSEDEDIQLLISKGKEFVSSRKSSESLESSAAGAAALPVADSLDKSVQTHLRKVSDPAAIVREVREKGLAQQLLAKGTNLLQSNSSALTPQQLLAKSKHLYTDDEARQQFLTQCKDEALNFLLSYLPNLKVAAIVGEKNKIEYKIDNIDLSGFQVHSNDVTVTIDNSKSLKITATNMQCDMKNLQWEYNKLSWPSFSSNGLAEATAHDIQFNCILTLTYDKIEKNSREQQGKHSTETTEKKEETCNNPQIGAADGFDVSLSIELCELHLSKLKLTISGSKFQSLYNIILNLFNPIIKQYLEKVLNKQITEKSNLLLHAINEAAKEYIPVLSRILNKSGEIINKTLEQREILKQNTPKLSAKQSSPPGSLSPPQLIV
jgi:hypothetical protein